MQGIYNYIPATNHVSRVYGFAAVLYLQLLLHVILLYTRNVFRIYYYYYYYYLLSVIKVDGLRRTFTPGFIYIYRLHAD